MIFARCFLVPSEKTERLLLLFDYLPITFLPTISSYGTVFLTDAMWRNVAFSLSFLSFPFHFFHIFTSNLIMFVMFIVTLN
jgi:hypothetical protein